MTDDLFRGLRDGFLTAGVVRIVPETFGITGYLTRREINPHFLTRLKPYTQSRHRVEMFGTCLDFDFTFSHYEDETTTETFFDWDDGMIDNPIGAQQEQRLEDALVDIARRILNYGDVNYWGEINAHRD